MIRWLRSLLSRVGRCDACERIRVTRFSPDHGANFCPRHYRENNAMRPNRWRRYLPHIRVQGGYRIVQIVGARRWSLAVFIKPKVTP